MHATYDCAACLGVRCLLLCARPRLRVCSCSPPLASSGQRWTWAGLLDFGLLFLPEHHPSFVYSLLLLCPLSFVPSSHLSCCCCCCCSRRHRIRVSAHTQGANEDRQANERDRGGGRPGWIWTMNADSLCLCCHLCRGTQQHPSPTRRPSIVSFTAQWARLRVRILCARAPALTSAPCHRFRAHIREGIAGTTAHPHRHHHALIHHKIIRIPRPRRPPAPRSSSGINERPWRSRWCRWRRGRHVRNDLRREAHGHRAPH